MLKTTQACHIGVSYTLYHTVIIPSTFGGRSPWRKLTKMSGVELIVGVVLGSVPIALEAYDRLGRTFEVFSIARHYPREVSILEARLSAQRTIFRNTAINLLTIITRDRLKVEEATNQPASAAARQALGLAPAYHDRIDALSESFVACYQTADQIRTNLHTLCTQLESFRAEVGEKKDALSSSAWLKNVKTRFKLGLNKPQIGKAVEELRSFNQDFVVITDQVQRMLQEALEDPKCDSPGTLVTVKSLNALQKYYRVRVASKALYTTLQVRWACTSHHCHSFDVRVMDRDFEQGKGKRVSPSMRYITCDLAITDDGTSYKSKGPLRLEIDQSCEEQEREETRDQVSAHPDRANLEHLETILEVDTARLQLNPVSAPKSSKTFGHWMGFQKKIVGKSATSVESLTGSVISSPPAHISGLTDAVATAQTSHQLNVLTAQEQAAASLLNADNFCKLFHEAMTGPIGTRCLVGSWKDPTPAYWYCLSSETSGTTNGPSVSQSISDLIRWVAEEPIMRSLPRTVLIGLASNVAEGIMQFYSTPWLVPTDLGQNVRYFNRAIDDSASATTACQPDLKGPYFTARVETRSARQVEVKSAKARRPNDLSSGTEGVKLAETRNELLYNFGILLLEIGYGRPWNQLKQSVASLKLSDYRAAEKLAQILINQMGPRYTKIIKQCLGCDFGLGETDLDNEDLQRRFLDDVVLGLQRLSNSMKEHLAVGSV